jgi:hypothetical protein
MAPCTPLYARKGKFFLLAYFTYHLVSIADGETERREEDTHRLNNIVLRSWNDDNIDFRDI